MSSSRPAHDPTARRILALARRYLRYGTRSTAQLRAYLDARHLPPSLRDALIAQCTREGLLDDAACTKLWATQLRERGYALGAIREQLLAKGLPAGMIEPTLTSLRADADDAQVAAVLVRGRRQKRSAGAADEPQRLARWLAQHGFDEDIIADVLSGAA